MHDYQGDDFAANDISVCSTCRKRVVQGRVARYEHDDCEPEQEDTARRREAIKRLHRDTARLLRKIGHPEEAAYHDREAER